jgi:arylsulfatase A-like enzyme/Tfp pilus assembly protein PilF
MRARKVITIALTVLAFATFAAAKSAKNPKAVPRPNVVLITVDTLRADRVGAYGSKNIATPGMDALARDGFIFEHAIAQVPLTVPSHDAIMTGTYPFRNGVQDFTSPPLQTQFQTLAQALQRHGYDTGAVVSAFVLDRSWGLARGFNFYYDAFAASTFQQRDIGLVDRRAGESVDKALEWLRKPHNKPTFLWLHLYDPHSPYDPPEPFRTHYSGRPYDGEVAYADSQLGRLFAWLKRNDQYDNSLIVLLSDHGESLGEHGEKEHGYFLYHATTRVPLIVKLPAGKRIAQTSQRISAPVETIAVAPTILELLGIHDPIEKQFQSTSLFSRHVDRQIAYSETFYPFSSFGWSPLHSVETSRYKYVDAPQPELYDLAADPGETRNLAPQQPATAAVLKEDLEQRLAAGTPVSHPQQASQLSPEAIEKLRSLGYFAQRAPVSAEAIAKGLADPKAKLREFNGILQAADAFHAGKFEEGEALLAKAQQQEPQLYLIPFMLGEAKLKQQDWPAAQANLERALALNPNFDQAMTGLARALRLQDNSEAARGMLQKALQQNPKNYSAWYELGWVEWKLNPADALKAFQKVVEIQPNFGFAHRDLGMLHFQQKDFAEATKQLREAARLGVSEPELWNFLGICYSRTSHLSEAIRSYRRALQLDPKFAEAHANLGFAYQQLNRNQEARLSYRKACELDQHFCKYAAP